MIGCDWNYRLLTSLILAALASGCGSGGSEPSDEPELHDLIVFEALGRLGTMAADGSGRQMLPTGDLEFAAMPRVSPDGKRVVFSGVRGDQWDIYVMNVDGSSRRQLTDDPAQDLSPSWHPGGDSVVFTWSPLEGPERGLVVMAADGTGRRQLAEEGAGGQWSPDGGRVMFYGSGDRDAGIYVIPTEGGDELRLDRECGNDCNDMGLRWSPDGEHITFVRYGEGGTPRLGIMRADGSEPRLLFPTLYTFGGIWSPDGARLAMNRWSDEEMRYGTYIVTVATGDTVRITTGFDFVSDWPR